jgi:osmotically-inducible protein OsmY
MSKNNSNIAIHPSHSAAEVVTTELRHPGFGLKKLAREWPYRSVLCRWAAILLIATGMQIPIFQTLHATTPKNEESGAKSTVKKITDGGITSAVEDELIFESGVYPNDVDVSTSQGIVTLFGSVDNLLAKDRALKIAESVRGVLGVIDRITVSPISRPDEDIRKDILMALLQDPATESYQVAVSVQDEVAKLTGSVTSYTEKELAARIARGVKGVKDIQNDITINAFAKRTDSEIQADINDRLQWDIWINGNMIYTVVSSGKVTLTGSVGSAIGKSRAYDDAWVSGVTSVDYSGVKVDPRERNDELRKLKYAIRPDSAIKKAVKAALRLDPRVSAFSPNVTVEDGSVRLSGVVGNLKAKISAEQDAKDIVSVWRVENFLKVRPKEQPSDADMKKQLTAALFWDPLLDGYAIEATVTNRIARLTGSVASIAQKAEAQDVASRTKGVLFVHNSIKIEPEFSVTYSDWPESYAYDWPHLYHSPFDGTEMFQSQPYLSDEQIRKKIEDKFFWSPFVDRDDIKITVDGGVATLTGTVGTRIGWNEANNDAEKSGAIEVVNHVTIKKEGWLP